MDFSSLQNLSQVLILIGIVITGLGGFGSYYFGKRNDGLKDKQTEQEINAAKEDRQELKEMLEPFIEYARVKYPENSDSTALSSLAEELKDLGQETKAIKEKTNELENKISFYSLTTTDINEIAQVLSGYESIQISIYRESNPDVHPFVEQLKEVFNKSNWTIKTSSTSLNKSFDGVNMFVGSKPNAVVPAFASNLYKLLESRNIKINKLLSDESLDLNEIILHVGKPKS